MFAVTSPRPAGPPGGGLTRVRPASALGHVDPARPTRGPRLDGAPFGPLSAAGGGDAPRPGGPSGLDDAVSSSGAGAVGR